MTNENIDISITNNQPINVSISENPISLTITEPNPISLSIEDSQPINVSITDDADINIALTGSTDPFPFTSLTDSPDSYSGQAGKVVLVNPTEDGVEFGNIDLSGYVPYTGATGDVNLGNHNFYLQTPGGSGASLLANGQFTSIDNEVANKYVGFLNGVMQIGDYNNGYGNSASLQYDTNNLYLVNTHGNIILTTTANVQIDSLSSNGFVKTSNSDGTLVVDTTSYLTTSNASTIYVPYSGANSNVDLNNKNLSNANFLSSSGSKVEQGFFLDNVDNYPSTANGYYISTNGMGWYDGVLNNPFIYVEGGEAKTILHLGGFADITTLKLDPYTTNGFVKTSSSDGTVVVDQTLTLPYVTKTANYTLDETNHIVEATANSFTMTLPTAVSISGRIYNIKNTGNGLITIATTSSQTIDGELSGTIKLSQYENITVVSDGSNWRIL